MMLIGMQSWVQGGQVVGITKNFVQIKRGDTCEKLTLKEAEKWVGNSPTYRGGANKKVKNMRKRKR